MLLDRMTTEMYNRIPERVKKTFLYSLFLGMISHIYILTNLLYNHDGVVNMYTNADALTSGRWFLKFATSMSGRMQMPAVIVIFSLIYLSILSCITIETVGIQSSLHMFMVSGLIVTFPTVVSTFSYLFTADAYFLSALLASLAVFFTKKWEKGWIVSIVLLAFSMGIYQAYLGYAAGMFAALILLLTLNADSKCESILKEGLKYVFVLISSIVLYYMILQIMLKINHTVLSNYRSIDQMGKYSLREIPMLLFVTYKELIDFYFVKGTYSYIPDFLVDTNKIIAGVMAVMFVWICYKRKIHRNIGKLLLCIFVIVMAPLAVNFIQIANPQEKPHTLMILSYVTFYIVFIRLTDMVGQELKKKVPNIAVMMLCNLLCAVVLYRGYIFTNEGYLRLQLEYESTYAFANRLTASIENSGYYDKDVPVWISGNFNYTEYPFRREEFNEMFELVGIFSDYIVYSNVQLKNFLDHTLNISFIEPESIMIEDIKRSEEYKNMGCYPHTDSIHMVNGILVVKLSEE